MQRHHHGIPGGADPIGQLLLGERRVDLDRSVCSGFVSFGQFDEATTEAGEGIADAGLEPTTGRLPQSACHQPEHGKADLGSLREQLLESTGGYDDCLEGPNRGRRRRARFPIDGSQLTDQLSSFPNLDEQFFAVGRKPTQLQVTGQDDQNVIGVLTLVKDLSVNDRPTPDATNCCTSRPIRSAEPSAVMPEVQLLPTSWSGMGRANPHTWSSRRDLGPYARSARRANLTSGRGGHTAQ